MVVQPRTRYIQNLDSLPLPAWNLFPMEAYSSLGIGTGSFGTRRYCLMETSRGCAMNCHYCGKNKSKGQGYRVRSPGHVLREIHMLVEDFGIEEVQFEDYNCLSNKPRWTEICQGIIDSGLQVSWSMPHGMQVKLLDREWLELFQRSGCDTLYLAVESGNQRYLDEMGKGVQLDHTREVLAIARDLGLAVCGYFMIGVVGESMDDIKATIDYALALDLDDVGFFIANPIPGSRLYETIAAQGLFVDGFDTSHIRYSMANVKSDQWTSADLQRIRHQAWQQNRKRNQEAVGGKFQKEFKTNIFLSEAECTFQ